METVLIQVKDKYCNIVYGSYIITNISATYASKASGAEYHVAYLLQSSCLNARITLRTQIGDYNGLAGKTISLIYDSANPLTIKTCGYQNDLFCQPNGGDCNIAINDNKCYILLHHIRMNIKE